VTYNVRCPKDPTHTHTLSKSKSSGKSPYPIANYVTCAKFSPKYHAFLATITIGHEPIVFSVAMNDEKWREAMKKELDALESSGTWTLAPLPPRKKAIR